ncbi:MAG: hypothetical protein PHV24_06305 [Candidatus Kapabacteria bacterium]|nr:hypothetical protein [Candidatus Kapabacteria bacterium]
MWEDRASEKAIKAGFHKAELIGTWNGYEVYTPEFNDDRIRVIGAPKYILINKNTERWVRHFEKEYDKINKALFNETDETDYKKLRKMLIAKFGKEIEEQL